MPPVQCMEVQNTNKQIHVVVPNIFLSENLFVRHSKINLIVIIVLYEQTMFPLKYP